ncbi:tetratricopeptide repeat-containing sensor histidine kinase [Christiangramia flava]|uniref:histidine kinase n=1 Tax=Christiangramia flava JLT2011 TaxID=1229726 RepID=A0A1L7IB67_9FLAO|nr:tetratricopeptide repeat-containing sensor histidine kinase [Christiangramia flava]APU70355.1 hypothetical protein GRFL_3631 [Christiangramia flava JLT2011]OSS37518.1 fructose sensor histidine kinase [Christiangramia flava JLT2011]
MKQLRGIIVLLLSISLGNAQTKQEIDSLNNRLVQNASITTDSLLSIYTTNLRNAEKLSYEKGIANSYQQLAVIHTYRGEYEKSTANMLEAIRHYEKADMPKDVAYAYGELGYGMKRRDMDKAQYYMNKGIKLARKQEFLNTLSRLYNNYGVLKEMQEQLDSAQYFYEEGLKLVEQLKFEEGLPYSYSNLAGVYSLKGNHQKAIEFFEKSMEIRQELDDQKGLAENYTQIGEVYLAQNRNEQAINFFQKSVPIARKEDYRFLVQYNYEKLAEAFKNLKNTDSSLFYFEKYSQYKDSISGLEVQKKLAELNVEFETEQKENELLRNRAELLQQEKDLRKKEIIIFSVVALLVVLAAFSYLYMRQQKLKREQLEKEKELEVALARIETQNRLEEQRIRISRDLHDNIGSQLTFIMSSLDNLRFKLKDEEPEISEKLKQTSIFTSQTINDLRDTVWAMNKESISFEELKQRLMNLLDQAREMNPEIYYSLRTDSNIDPERTFTALEGINFFRIIQEAVNNATKYSKGENIDVHIFEKKQKIFFQVSDDGVGFVESKIKKGNGLRNMQKRAELIAADINISSNGNTNIVVSKKIS